jgi:acetyl esterase/lipase
MRRIVAVIFSISISVLAGCQVPAQNADEDLPPGTRQLRNLEFARPNGIPLRLDLYVPPRNGPAPLIIWVHGGGWMEGDKDEDVEALPLLWHGYAVASVDYRLSDQAVFPAQIHDVKAAVRFLRANAARYGLDPDRFGAWGESAGGHLVALLGTTSVHGELEGNEGVTGVSSRVQAVFDWYGPTDLLQRSAQSPKGAPNADSPGSPDSRLLGGPVPRNREKAQQANPITYVTKGVPPFFVVHGDEDNVVPLGQSQLLVKALQGVNAQVRFTVIKGGQHGGDDYFSDEMFGEVRSFFDRYVKGDKRS